MKTKVWLSIDPQVLAAAQQLAKLKKQSFSLLIEDQLRILVNPENRRHQPNPQPKKAYSNQKSVAEVVDKMEGEA